jgi:hypothetical protein
MTVELRVKLLLKGVSPPEVLENVRKYSRSLSLGWYSILMAVLLSKEVFFSM